MLEFLNKRNAIISSIALATISFVILIDNTPQRIINIASKYYGIKEVGTNGGFNDIGFESKMKAIGWYQGAEWCAFFVKLIMLEVFKYNFIKKIALEKLMNGSSQITYRAFEKNKGFWHIAELPSKGSIVNWYKVGSEELDYPLGRGHFGIVYKVDKNNQTFYTIEGNQQNKISAIQHNLSEKNKTQKGQMQLVGFINLF